MAAPDFRQINDMLRGMEDMAAAFERIFADGQVREEQVRAKCAEQVREQAAEALAQIPTAELREARAGIRTAALEQAGFLNLCDLYRAPDWKLGMTEGIGDKQITSIRMILEEFVQRLSARERIRLTAETERGRELVLELARCRAVREICKDAQQLREEIPGRIAVLSEAVELRGRLRWIFSRRETKERTLAAVEALAALRESPEYRRAVRFVKLHEEVRNMPADAAEEDFRRNSAAYYALLEQLTGVTAPQEMIYSSVPAQLAAQIDAAPLVLDSFHGDLRAYQAFGARYILTQKRVLLGDEMGLGKTIQAIAAMSHLYSEDPGRHFLIVCPASVMINWCREIVHFSEIVPHLLHGTGLEKALADWQAVGGAAVTNYESLGRVVGKVDGKMTLAMLVIDEAHYIKNPEAVRTKRIHTLEEESERILMMTGTPLENRVDEMCELIGFVRPDMVPEIRTNAGMRHVPAFRELLAPVYLRRRRDQVLSELPPVTEEQEWCALTRQDLEFYAIEAVGKNFTGMRRVSFLQEDLGTSSKAARLLELCGAAVDEDRKVVIYSWFRETIRKVREMLEVRLPLSGEITGSTPAQDRQGIIDRFSGAPGGGILLCQVQAGGTGLNMQAASVVIFCEPQIKPSLTRQAVSRVFRMGQIRNVLVYHLLCENTVDEAVMQLLARKQAEFDLFADESTMADAADNLADREWIRRVVEEERRKYLPTVV